MYKICDKVRDLRKERGLTQKELASFLQVKNYVIADWEQGRSEPNVDLIRKLCVFFNISADEFLDIETQSERQQVQINNSLNNNSGKINIKF